jgi:outer membrane lipoprotein-sorting protein
MRKSLLALAAVLLPLGAASAAPSDLDFSATAVQTLPQKGAVTGKLYVTKGRMRQEVVQDGNTRITISDADQGVAWILNPERKEYVEMKGPAPGGSATAGGGRPPMPDETGHPCQQQASGLKCTKVATETVNGRAADKWEVVATQGQETFRSVMWVDQRLRLPVKAEFPGGIQSELRDVKEGPQPADLFTVPADYKKVELPQRPPQGQGQGSAPAAPPR